MAEKVKILKKDLPFLRKDLELESDVAEKLVKVQKERQKKFQSKIEAAQKKSLERYTAQIESLEKAKEEAVKQYDGKILKYQELVKSLTVQTKKVPSKSKQGKGKKME